MKFKDPDKLEFTAESSDVFISSEDEYLKKAQREGFDLEKLKNRKQDRKERKRYAKYIFRFMWIWCIAIFCMMLASGSGYLKFDNSVIITLITTTTANVLALFVIVASYLFFRNKKTL